MTRLVIIALALIGLLPSPTSAQLVTPQFSLDNSTKRLSFRDPSANAFVDFGGIGGLSKAVSVLAFGASTSPFATNNVAAFQAAAAAAFARGISTVFVPSGSYVLTGTVATALNSPVVFIGDGPSTIIRETSASADAFDFDSTSYLSAGGGLENMVIETGAGFRTAGSFGSGSTGFAIRSNHRNVGFHIKNVEINNFANPVGLYGCWDCVIQNFSINFYTGNAVLFDRGYEGGYGSGTRYAAGGAKLMFGKISDNGFTGSMANSVALRIKATGGNFYSTIDMTAGGRGIVIDPASANGEQVAYDNFFAVRPDTMSGNGIDIEGTGTIRSIDFTACWASYNSGYGVVTNNSDTSEINWSAGNIRQNILTGWLHQAGTKVNIVGAEISDNNRGNSTSPYYHGVDMLAGGINVRDSTFSNAEAGNQQFSVVIRSSVSGNVSVTNNDTLGGFTGSTGVTNQSTGPNIVVSGNNPS